MEKTPTRFSRKGVSVLKRGARPLENRLISGGIAQIIEHERGHHAGDRRDCRQNGQDLIYHLHLASGGAARFGGCGTLFGRSGRILGPGSAAHFKGGSGRYGGSCRRCRFGCCRSSGGSRRGRCGSRRPARGCRLGRQTDANRLLLGLRRLRRNYNRLGCTRSRRGSAGLRCRRVIAIQIFCHTKILSQPTLSEGGCQPKKCP